jgi:N-methylhydantoinase A/oxoprolinase/acetone carboxylase beta subunit
LIEIGAGGGSIARASTLGTLHVGPESAGAQPGPACYGRGGTRPTVTDADLALGYLNAEFFLGGMMRIDAKAAAAALRSVSNELGLDKMRGAFGVHDVVNEIWPARPALPSRSMDGCRENTHCWRPGALRRFTLGMSGASWAFGRSSAPPARGPAAPSGC